MDDYYSRVFVAPATRWNHIRNSNGNANDPRLEQKQGLSEASRDYFSMNIDVPGNFTYNVGDLVWCEVPSYNAAEQTNDHKVERDDVVDQLLTGRYLIKSLHHQIDLLEQKHTTAMTVVRNVFASDLPNADTFKANAHFRSQPVDVIGSGVDIASLTPFNIHKDLKIPSPQISTVEDVAKALNVDLSSTDLNIKDAANKAVNNVLNSTSNRVLQNKYLANINSAILTRKSVVEKIAEKAKLIFGGLKLPTTSNPMGRDRVLNNNFVTKAIVNFKNSSFGKGVSSFFNRFR
jgi:hypothetical protein